MARALDNLAGTPALAAYTASLIADGWDSEASLRAMDDYEKCLVSREGGGGAGCGVWSITSTVLLYVVCFICLCGLCVLGVARFASQATLVPAAGHRARLIKEIRRLQGLPQPTLPLPHGEH